VWLNFRSFPNNDPEMDVVMDRPSEWSRGTATTGFVCQL
jgi:hypothetical protein